METTRGNTKKVFFSGVLLLSFSTLLVKIIGLVYKIPMLSYLGSEGMGYFHSAYEIYALFCIIATAGLPVALSVLISEALSRREEEKVGRIYRAALWIFCLIGCGGTLLLWLGADWFCILIRSENAALCIRAISPTILFVCLSSAIRGYFQGYQKMLPTALSQLIEAIGKLVFGLLFAHLSLESGADTPTVAAAAGWGLTLGTALSTLYLFWEKLCRSPEIRNPNTTGEIPGYPSLWAHLGKLAVPMTLGAALVSVTKLVDMVMILRRLQSIGYSELAANQIYGSYTALALSVFGLLPTLLNSLFLPLVPMLSSAIAAGNREKQREMVNTSYRLTAFFALPAAIGVSAFSRPILLLLFGNDPEAVAVAAPLLSMLGASVFLSSMISATNSVLHAYQVVNRPILSMLAGAAVKVAIAYFLIGNPIFGIIGAPISTFFCNLTVVLCNFIFAAKLCGRPAVKEIFLRPLLLSVLSVGGAYLGYRLATPVLGESRASALLFMSLAGLFYLIAALISGAFSAADIDSLPFGDKLLRILRKFRLICR